MAAFPPKALILGHSFVRRLCQDLDKGFDNRASADFSLKCTMEVKLCGFGGMTVTRLQAGHLLDDEVLKYKPNIVILELGTNDLGRSRPEVVGSKMEELVSYLKGNLGVSVVGVSL